MRRCKCTVPIQTPLGLSRRDAAKETYVHGMSRWEGANAPFQSSILYELLSVLGLLRRDVAEEARWYTWLDKWEGANASIHSRSLLNS